MTNLFDTIAALPRLARVAARVGPRRKLPAWAVSWLQVSPLALVLFVLFALPTILFVVVSFFDYDRVGLYPAFILDNYRDLLTTPATIRVYVSS
jgi:putative spermidine/putrescine transport system permease protein